MKGAEFRRLGSRLLVLLFLLAGLSFVDGGRPSAVAADDCYADCQRVYRFCRDHPDGLYENLDGINECSSFVSVDFCWRWDCPHPFYNKFTYSPCLYNPSLPECDCTMNPNGPTCGGPMSPQTCPNVVDNCQTTCENAAAAHPGYHCCSWSVSDDCMSCTYMLCPD